VASHPNRVTQGPSGEEAGPNPGRPLLHCCDRALTSASG
jgi:hypothetical protein